MSISRYMIFALLTISQGLWGQQKDLLQDLQAIFSAYEQLDDFQVAMDYVLYADQEGDKELEREFVQYQQLGGNSQFVIGELAQLQIADYFLTIDHEEQSIFVQNQLKKKGAPPIMRGEPGVLSVFV